MFTTSVLSGYLYEPSPKMRPMRTTSVRRKSHAPARRMRTSFIGFSHCTSEFRFRLPVQTLADGHIGKLRKFRGCEWGSNCQCSVLRYPRIAPVELALPATSYKEPAFPGAPQVRSKLPLEVDNRSVTGMESSPLLGTWIGEGERSIPGRVGFPWVSRPDLTRRGDAVRIVHS